MNKKIAIPTTNGVLSAHFGHCEKFALYDVENDKIIKEDNRTILRDLWKHIFQKD